MLDSRPGQGVFWPYCSVPGERFLNTKMKTSFRVSLLALSIAALPLPAQAAGLGQINVYSGLGQPLRAEILVSATAQELQSLSARIASAEAFRQANLVFGSAASAIRVTVDTRAPRPVIRLSSDRPLNDPFVDLLVELNWATGRLVREYTFLLDPVDLTASRPLAAAPDAPVAPQRPTAAAPQLGPKTYAVRRGDTLHRIASASAQPDTTLDQMLLALLRANPEAFDGGNINRLRAGAVLSMPDADMVRSIDDAQARRELRAQAIDFEAYRQGLATAASSAAPVPPVEAEQERAGRVVTKLETPAATPETGDQLRVSHSDGAGDASAEARLQALEEELSTRSKALEEANERLAQLERSLRDLQRLLELQSAAMGQPQARAEKPAAAPQPVSVEAPAQSSLVDALLADSRVLAGGGASLALLLAYASFRLRQRRRETEIQAADAALGASAMAGDQHGVLAGSGRQRVDTVASSAQHADFSPSELSSIDTDEGVDPVAEADVYMAYGRDVQAEEILQDALKADPGRTGIYVKLLEIYAQRRSRRQFAVTASELFARTGGRGRDWDKAAALGRKFDPPDPLAAMAQDHAGGGIRQAAAGADALTTAGVATGVAAGGLAAASAVSAAEVQPAAADQASEALRLSSLDFTASGQAEPAQAKQRGTWTLPGDPGVLRGEEPPVGAMAIQAGVIDFDLELGEAVPAAEQTTEPLPARGRRFGPDLAHAAAAGAGENPTEIGTVFDLYLGEPEAAADEVQVAASLNAVRPPVPTVDAGLVTGLDDAGQRVTSLDFELPDLPELDLDSPQARADLNATVVTDLTAHFDQAAAGALNVPSSAPPAGVREPSAVRDQVGDELERTRLDRGLLDFDFDLDVPGSPTALPSAAPAGLDLTSIDLELDFGQAADPAAPEVGLAPFSLAETRLDELPGRDAGAPAAEAAVSEDDEGVETKLELARAYEEMGDKAGALALLEEVVGEGSARQRAAARDIIARLG